MKALEPDNVNFPKGLSLEIDNIDKSIATIIQSLQVYMQMQDKVRVQKYMQMLDDMNMQKLKLLGQDSIVEKGEEMEEKVEIQQQQQAQMMPEQAQQGVM